MTNPPSNDPRVHELAEKAREQIAREAAAPFTVSVMGQTGVGKSSLINALFRTNLETDAIRPCTKKVEKVVIRGSDAHELWFYDLPGIGESDTLDTGYLEEYRRLLLSSDIVLWLFHSDCRSITLDRNALHHILGADPSRRASLMSKIIFVLSKVDLLVPPPWIYAKCGDCGFFTPNKAIRMLLAKKELYYQDTFIRPHGDSIVSQTYNNGSFQINEHSLSYNEDTVCYKGFLNAERLDFLKSRYPRHTEVFDRLYDNYRVIPCSSLFRFNLNLLLLIVVNKLGKAAISRFKVIAHTEDMGKVPVSKMRTYCNLVVFDQQRQQVAFDLSKVDLM